MSTERFDVVIVGGAAIGSAVAYFLLHDLGFAGTLAVIERDPTYAHAATTLSAASIRQQFSTPENIRMSRFGLAFFDGLKLRFGRDASVGFRAGGYLLLADASGRAVLAANHAIQQAEHAEIALMDAPELKARFPWLETSDLAAGAFGRSGEGWFDAHALLELLRRGARERGAVYLHGDVTGVERRRNPPRGRAAGGRPPHRLRHARQRSRPASRRGRGARRAQAAGRAAQALRVRDRVPRRTSRHAAHGRHHRRVGAAGRQRLHLRRLASGRCRPARREFRRGLRFVRNNRVAGARAPRAGDGSAQARARLGRALRLQRARPERGGRAAPAGAQFHLCQRLLRPRVAAGAGRRPRGRRADRARAVLEPRSRALRLRTHRRRPSAAGSKCYLSSNKQQRHPEEAARLRAAVSKDGNRLRAWAILRDARRF